MQLDSGPNESSPATRGSRAPGTNQGSVSVGSHRHRLAVRQEDAERLGAGSAPLGGIAVAVASQPDRDQGSIELPAVGKEVKADNALGRHHAPVEEHPCSHLSRRKVRNSRCGWSASAKVLCKL